jgi:hypothetical protein
MNKIILELHEGVDLESAVKMLGELPIVADVKYIQKEEQKSSVVKSPLKPTELTKNIKEWESNPEFEDFWKTK